MKEKIEEMYIQALIDDLPPNVFADQVSRLFDDTQSVGQHCLLFANWLRVNFNNSPEEFDNYWEDIFYTVDKIRQKNYTTEELYEWWSNNVA